MLLVAQPSNAIPLLPEYSMSCRADDECDHKTNGSSVNDDHADPSLPQKLDVSFSKKVKSRRSFKRLQGLFSGFGNQHKAKAKHGSSSTPTTPLEPPQMVDFALNSTPNGFSNNVKSAASVPSSRPTSPVPSPSLSRKMPTVTAQANLKKALGLKRKTRSAKTLTSLWSPSPQGNNQWCSLSGRTVELKDVKLKDLCEAERVALQRVALEELNAFCLGCHIQIPKDGSRRGLLKRGINLRRSFGLSVDRDKKNKDILSASVFGQQLTKVLSHDRSIMNRIGQENAAPTVNLPNHHLSSQLFEGGNSSSSQPRHGQAEKKVSISSVSSASDAAGSMLSSPSPPPERSPDDGETGSRHATWKRPYLFSIPRSASSEGTALVSRDYDEDKVGDSDRPTGQKVRAKSTDSALEPESTILHLTSFESAMAAIVQSGMVAADVVSTAESYLSKAESYPVGNSRRRKNSAPDLSYHTSLCDALALSPLVDPSSKEDDRHSAFMPLPAQVPLIVSRSMKFLEEHGLHATGLFRVPGSKKRICQMRDEFDYGRDVHFSEDLNPTDVAGLLKAFLRDLPEPLLTKELYAPFIATRRLEDPRERAVALNLLCTLLPPANRDTLSELLQFLQLVSSHASCACGGEDVASDENGGNKMDKRNLATVVGPNILHKVKGGKEFQVLTRHQADDQDEVISVMEEMIEENDDLFKVSSRLHNAVFKKLVDSEPDAVDYLLKKKCLIQGEDVDGEELAGFSHQGFRSRVRSDGSVFSSDCPVFQLTPSESFSAEHSSIVLCNPAARGSSGSLPRSGSEARDLDSLSSGYISPFDSASPPQASSALESSSLISNAIIVDGQQFVGCRDGRMIHSQSSHSLDRYRSPPLTVSGSDPTCLSSRNSPQRLPVQLVSPLRSDLTSSRVVTMVTPATPDMSRRLQRSQSSLVRMKGSLDLRSSDEELSSREPSPEVDGSSRLHHDATDGVTHDASVQVDVDSVEKSDLVDITRKSDKSHENGQVHVHQFPWQNRHFDWTEDIDLLEQETLV